MAKTKGAKAQESKLIGIQTALNTRFLERSEIIHGMMVALVSRANIFLLGPPGTAKSDLALALCGAITGAEFFSWLLSKLSTPEELYGPPSFSAMKEDKYVRITTGKMPNAHITFLDEIWKSSSAIANTLLPIINERTFFNGSGAQKVPLELCVSASNELPQGEELAALWDRFALRYVTRLIQDDDNFRAMLGGIKAEIPSISLKELAAEQEAALRLEISEEALKAIIALRRECAQRGFYVSDRKWVMISKILRAHAYLRGHDEVLAEDLEILQHVLWNDDKQIPEVRKLVFKHSFDIGEELIEIQDAISEIQMGLEERAKKTDKTAQREMTEYGIESNSKLKVLNGKLDKMLKLNPAVTKIAELQMNAKSLQQQIQKAALGF